MATSVYSAIMPLGGYRGAEVNNVPLSPRIASRVSDQKEVISFFCSNDKFVVSIAKRFIYCIIEV